MIPGTSSQAPEAPPHGRSEHGQGRGGGGGRNKSRVACLLPSVQDRHQQRLCACDPPRLRAWRRETVAVQDVREELCAAS